MWTVIGNGHMARSLMIFIEECGYSITSIAACDDQIAVWVVGIVDIDAFNDAIAAFKKAAMNFRNNCG